MISPQASQNHFHPWVLWPRAPLQYIIQDIMDVISECTYHPIAPAGRCLKSRPRRTRAAHLRMQFMTFLKVFFFFFLTDVRVVECIERSISETNDRATRSISRKPYGKSFRVIITLLLICFYLFHLSRPEKNGAKWLCDAANDVARHIHSSGHIYRGVFLLNCIYKSVLQPSIYSCATNKPSPTQILAFFCWNLSNQSHFDCTEWDGNLKQAWVSLIKKRLTMAPFFKNLILNVFFAHQRGKKEIL